MSPTSYQTAPPREVIITTTLGTVKQTDIDCAVVFASTAKFLGSLSRSAGACQKKLLEKALS